MRGDGWTETSGESLSMLDDELGDESQIDQAAVGVDQDPREAGSRSSERPPPDARGRRPRRP
jgi:hypothetical protein